MIIEPIISSMKTASAKGKFIRCEPWQSAPRHGRGGAGWFFEWGESGWINWSAALWAAQSNALAAGCCSITPAFDVECRQPLDAGRGVAPRNSGSLSFDRGAEVA